MNRGYVRLWRKSLEAGWLKNHKLWAFWSYCLLKATHKEFNAVIGLQTVHLMPGQFIFGLHKAKEETGLSIRSIRTIIDFLRKAQNLTIKTTNKYSIITIVNWQTYQTQENENDKQNDKPLTNKGQHTRTKEHKNISPEEIQSLEERYSDKDLINQCFKSISSTRKTNRISDSVKLNILNKWNEYPAEQVKAAMRIYLEKGYAAQGKEENYLLGIIRGNAKQQPAANISSGKVMKRTGSMLDKVYQEQGFTLI